MIPQQEKMPGKFIAAGVFMIILSIFTLTFILLALIAPIIITLVLGISITYLADMLAGMMNTMSGSAELSPFTMSVFGVLVFVILVLLIIYYAAMLVHGVGIVRGRLTKKRPYYLAFITLATVIIPPWGGLWMILKILTAIMIILSLRDDRVNALYHRANDPEWETRPPPPRGVIFEVLPDS